MIVWFHKMLGRWERNKLHYLKWKIRFGWVERGECLCVSVCASVRVCVCVCLCATGDSAFLWAWAAPGCSLCPPWLPPPALALSPLQLVRVRTWAAKAWRCSILECMFSDFIKSQELLFNSVAASWSCSSRRAQAVRFFLKRCFFS